MVAKNIFGILIVIGFISLLSFSPFYRFSRTFKELEWMEYVWFYFGWLLGIVYWIFYRDHTVYVMAWSGWYIIVGAACITMGFARNIDKKYIYLLIANVAATIVFVCTILFLTIETFMAVLVTAILLMLSLGSVPIAYNNIEGNTPTIIKIICACLIGGGVAAIAIVGWVTDVASNFAVFSFVMGAIYAVLFVVASAMFLEREAN